MPSEVMTSSSSLVSARPFGVERGGGEGQAGRVEQRRHVVDDDVARVEIAVGDVELEGVVAGGVDDALVVGDDVVEVALGVVGDAREAADLGALELGPVGRISSPEELELGRPSVPGIAPSAMSAST